MRSWHKAASIPSGDQCPQAATGGQARGRRAPRRGGAGAAEGPRGGAGVQGGRARRQGRRARVLDPRAAPAAAVPAADPWLAGGDPWSQWDRGHTSTQRRAGSRKRIKKLLGAPGSRSAPRLSQALPDAPRRSQRSQRPALPALPAPPALPALPAPQHSYGRPFSKFSALVT